MAGYPSYRYHATESPVVVNDEAEDTALGKGWYDSPVVAPDAPDDSPEAVDDAPKAKGKGKK